MNQDHYSDYAKEWTQRMRDGKNIIHEYIAKPALYKQIGDVKGKDILCIGCGSGEECSYLKEIGANRVVGIDLSPALIDIAKESYSGIEFYVMDMESIDLEDDSFDMVLSSLTLHYVSNWTQTLIQINKVLRKNGNVIISTNHPIRFGAEVKRMPDREIFVLGYIRYKAPKVLGDTYGDYLTERKITDKWFRDRFEVTYYHRPISAIIKDIKESSFDLVDFLEPLPETWVKEANESFYYLHSKIPLIMIFELKKR